MDKPKRTVLVDGLEGGSTKTRNKRTAAERERDLDLIAGLYLEGRSQLQIAEAVSGQYQFNLTRQQIGYDLEKVRGRWLESSVQKIDQLKAEQLAKIDRLEAKYCDGYERSLRAKQTTTTEKVFSGGGIPGAPGQQDGRSRATIRSEQTVGDPRWLVGIGKCIDMRCALVGLNAPVKAIVSSSKTWMDILRERYKNKPPDEPAPPAEPLKEPLVN